MHVIKRGMQWTEEEDEEDGLRGREGGREGGEEQEERIATCPRFKICLLRLSEGRERHQLIVRQTTESEFEVWTWRKGE